MKSQEPDPWLSETRSLASKGVPEYQVIRILKGVKPNGGRLARVLEWNAHSVTLGISGRSSHAVYKHREIESVGRLTAERWLKKYGGGYWR